MSSPATVTGLVPGAPFDGAVDVARTSRSVAEEQRAWAAMPVRKRMVVLRRARGLLAAHTKELVCAIPATPDRTPADTLAAEVLPLLEACRFLERNAARILSPRRLGRRGLPFWLAGVASSVERVPFGTVLVIAPSNYPLFLAGAQVLQALAAGNAVVWKPGRGGLDVALVMRHALERAGLPSCLLRVTDESVGAAEAELSAGPDKVIFTGSRPAGIAVLHATAETQTPVVAELSGADAVIVLRSADPQRVVDALSFGMRLNGSATCMAPRRLILVGEGHEALLLALRTRFATMVATTVSESTRAQLESMLAEAAGAGAEIAGSAHTCSMTCSMRPVLVLDGHARLRVATSDIFAPVLTVLRANTVEELPALEALCPFGLTVSIFGREDEALEATRMLAVGSVLVNDLIVPTADPRIPFGGRRGSGFGSTRGMEGLLEMTAPRVVSVRRGGSRRHYAATTAAHAEMFEGAIAMSHGSTLGRRLRGFARMVAAGRKLT